MNNQMERFASAMAAELRPAVQEEMATFDRRILELEKKINRPKFGRRGPNNEALAKEQAALAEFVRGRKHEFVALSVGSSTEGGYLVHPEFSREIVQKLHDVSPIRSLARVVEMRAGDSFVEPVDVNDADAAWVGEQQARPETAVGDIGLNRIPLTECYALVKITQRLLDDSQFDVAEWITEKLVDRFARLEGEAFVRGNSNLSPKGFLSYDTSAADDNSRADLTYQFVPSGSATEITADSIISLVYALRAPYRQGATIVMNSDTGRRVRQLKDGSGQYLVVPGLALDQPDRLCGVPVRYCENMPGVMAGAYPIAIANWPRAYTIVERHGIKWLTDPYSSKPHVLLYATRRVGGQSSGDTDALKLLKIAES